MHHRGLEHALTATGLEWVILRPGMFAMIVGGMPESIADTMLSMGARSEGQPATVVADERH